ncbi:MAG: GH3 auxin-responsive promoter family protein [Chloroflexota bacterium]
MPTAADLLRQGRSEDIWQRYCGFTDLNLEQFMTIQKRLLLEQIELLNASPLGARIMGGNRPETIEEFRQCAPLTTYSDYCPELLEQREDMLPVKPAMWVHTSGRSGEYPFKWIPLTPAFAEALSITLYGVGNLSHCRERGDTTRLTPHPKVVYTVAPRPYISGTMASLIEMQTPLDFFPQLEKAENLTFDERIKLGFQQSLSAGMDYFFGLSLVLVAVGEKFQQSSAKVDLRPYLKHPKALLRLARGVAKSRMARRSLLPRDLWQVRGIISSGLDSWVYRDRIRELWGRYPLDIYAGSEGGVYATQTWDFSSMTFIPNLNFLEFIPEEEHFKWQLDRSYPCRTVLLDEVRPGENYELVITNFHGGALVRYRVGDLVKITALRNERLGIELPQMVFERRADGLLDFNVIRLSEKEIWQALENTGIGYADWMALKNTGDMSLHLFVELKNGSQVSEEALATAVYDQLARSDSDSAGTEMLDDTFRMHGFGIKVKLLPRGTFASYTAARQAEGADIAHIKPPHINPSKRVLSMMGISAGRQGVEIRGSEEADKVAAS